MSRLVKLTALLLAILWLPATLHCDLEAAEIHFLAHDDHHDPVDHNPDTEHHSLDDAAFTASAPTLKVVPPSDSIYSVFAAAFPGEDLAEPVLSPVRHPPPPGLRVAWQFCARAAPPAQAP